MNLTGNAAGPAAGRGARFYFKVNIDTLWHGLYLTVSSERRRLDERTLPPAFHLAVIEKAMRFVDEQRPHAGTGLQAAETAGLRAACKDAP